MTENIKRFHLPPNLYSFISSPFVIAVPLYRSLPKRFKDNLKSPYTYHDWGSSEPWDYQIDHGEPLITVEARMWLQPEHGPTSLEWGKEPDRLIVDPSFLEIVKASAIWRSVKFYGDTCTELCHLDVDTSGYCDEKKSALAELECFFALIG